MVKMPIWTSTMFFRDYYHRTNAIDFQIELYLYVLKNRWTIALYDTYYDYTWANKTNSPLKAKTKLTFKDWTFFIPDAILKIKLQNQIKIFIFEIYNWNDTKRVVSQLCKHIQSLKEWLPSIALNENIGSRVLLLFDTKNASEAVINRISNDDRFENFINLFLFNDADTIKSNFNSWHNAKNEHIEL